MTSAAEMPAALHGSRILVVDDEFMIASDLDVLFSAAGARVVLATTLLSALAAARKLEITVALLDLRLGTDSSECVADALLARRIPFLFFSGRALPDAMRRKFPHAHCLCKPLGFRDLLGATAELLQPAA